MDRMTAYGIAHTHRDRARKVGEPSDPVPDWVIDAILAAANRPAPPPPDDTTGLYETLNRPAAPSDVEDAARAFFDVVAVARVEHGIPDVQVIAQARVTSPTGPRSVIASSYWGDSQANQLALLARKYGEARAAHEHALGDLIEQGRRAAVERGSR